MDYDESFRMGRKLFEEPSIKKWGSQAPHSPSIWSVPRLAIHELASGPATGLSDELDSVLD